MTSKLYISGPMTGLPELNVPAFRAAAVALTRAGFKVCDPTAMGSDPSKSWADYMRYDIAAMLLCTAVATLPGWENSKGAKLEVHIAHELGMRVLTVDQWVTGL